MKNSQKGFVTPLIIAVIVALAIGGGVYYSKTKKESSQSRETSISLSATKNGQTVNVSVTKGGQPYKTFSYQERFPREDSSGNTWRMLPASVSLSPDQRFIAYADNDGLQLLELSADTVTLLRPNTVTPSVEPMWSPDSRYVVYTQVGYEGSSKGIADIQTKKYKDNVIVGSTKNINWSENNGKVYLQYSGYESSEYGAPKGTHAAEVTSIETIKFEDTL